MLAWMFMQSFWGRDGQEAFFDVKVLLPFASSYASTPLTQCYRQAKLDKRRKYDEPIQEVERGTFSPLIFPHQVEWAPQQRLFIDTLLL